MGRKLENMDGKEVKLVREKRMEKNKIAVAWGLDKKYVLQAFVVMRSILKHSDEDYHFFIFTADHIENEVKEYENNLRTECSNFEIMVKMVDINRLADAQIHNLHLSKAAYFRLFIPEMLLEYNKCIYLDCDLIVHGNLRGLYEIEIENYYLAGVIDCHVVEDTPFQIKHQQILGLPSRDRYINSGVLLMNLDKLRKDKKRECFWEQLKNENWYEDQDVLNLCCYPLIKVIPLKYNLFHFYLGNHIKFLYDLPYDKYDFDFNHEYPFILHMGADCKPWNSFWVNGSKEWWHLAEIFNESQAYHAYLQKCQNADTYNETKDLLDRVQKSEHVVIWGFGKNGKRLCDLFYEYQLENIIAFADNNAVLRGKKYRGVQVRDLFSIMKEYHNVLWIVSCEGAYDEIAEELQDQGIDQNSILRYRNLYGNSGYLLSLTKEAYANEINKIADMEYIRMISDQTERRKYIYEIIRNPLMHTEEYAYLEEKYCFQYWINTLE